MSGPGRHTNTCKKCHDEEEYAECNPHNEFIATIPAQVSNAMSVNTNVRCITILQLLAAFCNTIIDISF